MNKQYFASASVVKSLMNLKRYTDLVYCHSDLPCSLSRYDTHRKNGIYMCNKTQSLVNFCKKVIHVIYPNSRALISPFWIFVLECPEYNSPKSNQWWTFPWWYPKTHCIERSWLLPISQFAFVHFIVACKHFLLQEINVHRFLTNKHWLGVPILESLQGLDKSHIFQ